MMIVVKIDGVLAPNTLSRAGRIGLRLSYLILSVCQDPLLYAKHNRAVYAEFQHIYKNGLTCPSE